MAVARVHGQFCPAGDEVHVWQVDLDISADAVKRLFAHLSAEERERAARFAFPLDRDRFIVARGVLRDLLSAYLHQPPADVRIVTSAHGKPALMRSQGIPDLRFNLSHSHGLALYAFTLQREVGIDIEKIRLEFATDGIAERYFSVREQEGLRALSSEVRAEAFFLCWTRKEAYLKARGQGLRIPLASFDVSTTLNEPPALTSADSHLWSLHSLRPATGFVGALVVEGPISRLCVSEW